MWGRLKNSFYFLSTVLLVSHTFELVKEEVDKVIEDEITQKLGADLLQSIERKFQADLERSVDMVLEKIKLLLQNGTHHIQEKLAEIQGMLDAMKKNRESEVEECLLKKQNETSSLAEKALHQMVVCGYALIGQDPAMAINTVVKLKNIIKQGVKPIHEQKGEIYSLLKVCGHEHDALRKVVRCVMSKSPLIKSVMMDITGRMVEGVLELTKLMAHGAMHEACLIEVVKSIEDEAMELLKEVKYCAHGNNIYDHEFENFIAHDNATVLDVSRKKTMDSYDKSKVHDLKDMLIKGSTDDDVNKRFQDNILNLKTDIDVIDNDVIVKDLNNQKGE